MPKFVGNSIRSKEKVPAPARQDTATHKQETAVLYNPGIVKAVNHHVISRESFLLC